MAYSTPAFHGCQVFFINLSFMSKDPRLPVQRSSHCQPVPLQLQTRLHHAYGYLFQAWSSQKQHHLSTATCILAAAL